VLRIFPGVEVGYFRHAKLENGERQLGLCRRERDLSCAVRASVRHGAHARARELHAPLALADAGDRVLDTVHAGVE
jgi:hypothetical protein